MHSSQPGKNWSVSTTASLTQTQCRVGFMWVVRAICEVFISNKTNVQEPNNLLDFFNIKAISIHKKSARRR